MNLQNSNLTSLTYSFDWPRHIQEDPIPLLTNYSQELTDAIELAEYWDFKLLEDNVHNYSQRILVVLAFTQENLTWMLLKYPNGKNTLNV
jgi:hypothetical protein